MSIYPMLIMMVGIPGSGKSTIAKNIVNYIMQKFFHLIIIEKSY